jgi:hypothetical protein
VCGILNKIDYEAVFAKDVGQSFRISAHLDWGSVGVGKTVVRDDERETIGGD